MDDKKPSSTPTFTARVNSPIVGARIMEAGPALTARLDAIEQIGLFARPFLLDGATVVIGRPAVEALAAALVTGERAAVETAAASVISVVDFSTSDPETAEDKKRTKRKSDRLATSYYARSNTIRTDWPFKAAINGAIVIVGESESGKTTWISKNANPDFFVRVSEPLEAIDSGTNVFGADTFDVALGFALGATIIGYNVAVDSLRGMMYSMGGNTMEGGVAAGLFELLTTLNNVAADCGGTILFAVNPMTGSPDKLAVLNNRIKASVSGIIVMADGRVAESSVRKIDGTRGPVIGIDTGDSTSTRKHFDSSESRYRGPNAPEPELAVPFHLSLNAEGLPRDSRVPGVLGEPIKSGERAPAPSMPKLNYD